MSNESIKIPIELTEAQYTDILYVLENTDDEGPRDEGWKSEEREELIRELKRQRASAYVVLPPFRCLEQKQ